MHETAGDNGVAPQGFIGRTKEWAETMIARLNTPRLRPAFGAVALVAILGLVFTLSPVGSLADQLFKTFRVQQFQAITVHVPQMSSLPQPSSDMGQITPEQMAQFQAMLAPLGTPTTNATANSAREVADQVCFLHDGRIHEQGHPEQVLGDPQQERTRAFLSRIRAS